MNETWIYRRGDIYLVDLGTRFGSEQGGCRPVLLIQNDVGNSCGPTLIVAPITARAWKKAEQPTHYRLENIDCLSKLSMVLLEQIITIDKRRIKKYMGSLKKEQMNRIDICIAVSLGLVE